MSRLTYKGGADGMGDPDATLTDCPVCGQAVRVELHRWRLSAVCYGGCSADQLTKALDAPRLIAEMQGVGS